MFGSTELIVIVLIIFLLFGASAIPKFAKSIGQARKEFEKEMKDTEKTNSESQSEPTKDET